MHQCNHLSCADASQQDVRLRLATANVLTLFPQHDVASTFLGARAEHLAAQFRAAQLHCVGLQETRYRKHGHDYFSDFHVLSAGATARGQGGVQLWLLRKIPTDCDPLHIEHEHLRIIHGDDRRLFVQMKHPRISLFFLVLHAPCCDDEQLVQQWWASTSALIPGRYRSWTWVILCDSNGRVGSVPSSAVGSFGAEQETIRGAAFHDWLVAHRLILPQTHAESHHGDHDTWTHAEGSQGRLDFIGLSDNIPLSRMSTWVSIDVGLSIARPDHRCVCADIWISVSQSVRMQSAAPLPHLQEHDLTWACDVHTHAGRLQSRLNKQLMVKPQRCLRKTHLSEETYELIVRKRKAHRALQDAKTTSRLARLHLCFVSWRSSGSHRASSMSTFQCDCKLALAAEAYRLATLRVCFAVRHDDRRFFDDLAEGTGALAERGIHRIWDAINQATTAPSQKPKKEQHSLHRAHCSRTG